MLFISASYITKIFLDSAKHPSLRFTRPLFRRTLCPLTPKPLILTRTHFSRCPAIHQQVSFNKNFLFAGF